MELAPRRYLYGMNFEEMNDGQIAGAGAAVGRSEKL